MMLILKIPDLVYIASARGGNGGSANHFATRDSLDEVIASKEVKQVV